MSFRQGLTFPLSRHWCVAGATLAHQPWRCRPSRSAFPLSRYALRPRALPDFPVCRHSKDIPQSFQIAREPIEVYSSASTLTRGAGVERHGECEPRNGVGHCSKVTRWLWTLLIGSTSGLDVRVGRNVFVHVYLWEQLVARSGSCCPKLSTVCTRRAAGSLSAARN